MILFRKQKYMLEGENFFLHVKLRKYQSIVTNLQTLQIKLIPEILKITPTVYLLGGGNM
jgi:hypothetical protein